MEKQIKEVEAKIKFKMEELNEISLNKIRAEAKVLSTDVHDKHIRELQKEIDELNELLINLKKEKRDKKREVSQALLLERMKLYIDANLTYFKEAKKAIEGKKHTNMTKPKKDSRVELQIRQYLRCD